MLILIFKCTSLKCLLDNTNNSETETILKLTFPFNLILLLLTCLGPFTVSALHTIRMYMLAHWIGCVDKQGMVP